MSIFITVLIISTSQAFYSNEISVISLEKPVAIDLGWKTMGLLALVVWYFTQGEKQVLLIDFACFEPPESWKVSHDQLMQMMKAQNCFTEESLDFLSRMLQQSGCGPSTAWPPG